MNGMTAQASRQLHIFLKMSGALGTRVVRLCIDDGDCRYKLDERRSSDRCFEYDGHDVLVVDEQTDVILGNATLHYDQRLASFQIRGLPVIGAARPGRITAD